MGDLGLMRIDRALPAMVSRAERHGCTLTVTLLRPGPTRPRGDLSPSSAELADLAAAVSVQLEPAQSLYQATGGRLAVVTPAGRGHRVSALVRRARAGGAPTCSWVSVRYPRDARSAKALLELAVRRLDGRAGGADAHGAAGLRRRAAAAAAAAAVLAVVATVFALGGPRPGALAAAPLRSAASATTDASSAASVTGGGSGSAPGPGTGSAGAAPAGGSSPGPAGQSGPAPGTGSAGPGASGSGSVGGSDAAGSSSTTVAAPTTTATSPGTTTTTTTPLGGLGGLVPGLFDGLLGDHR